MTDTQTALDHLNELLSQYDTYNATIYTAKPSGIDSRALYYRLRAAIERLTVPTSVYAKEMARVLTRWGSSPLAALPELAPIALALRDDIAGGWLTSIVELAHADTYASYLEMAEGLIGQGYKDPAAVIAGTSLEVHLKALAAKHGVDLQTPNGRQKMASGLNDDLKREGVLNALEHKQVTAWLAVRNSAAHGDYGDYDEVAVKRLIEGVGNLAAKYLA